MFNLLQVQDRLKQLPDQELQQELRAPDPETQALVMSEVERRQRLRQGVPQGPKKSIYEQMLGMAGPPPPRFPPGGPPPGLAGMLPAQGQMGMGPGAAAPGPVPGSAGAGLMGMPGPALSPLAAMRPPGLAGGGEVVPGYAGGAGPLNSDGTVSDDASAYYWPPYYSNTSTSFPAPRTGFPSASAPLPQSPPDPQTGGSSWSWLGPLGASEMGGSAPAVAAQMESTQSSLSPERLQQMRSGTYRHQADMVNDNPETGVLPKGVLSAVAEQESGFDPRRVGTKNDVGIMQITPSFAHDWGIDLEDRRDVLKSLQAGKRYFLSAIPKVGLYDALRGYNAGPTAAARDTNAGKDYADQVWARLPEETRNYLDSQTVMAPAAQPLAGPAASPAAPPPPDPYADAANELMKRYAALGPQKPQQITPEQWQAWQVKPNELQQAPKADYAAALDRAKQFLPNDGNYDKLQAQIDAMREASGARPLSLGEKMILIGAGMKNRWDFAGGFANELQAEQNETQAARDRAMKLYGFQSDLSQMRERQQDAVMRLGQGLAESDQRTAAANAEAQNRALEANRVIQENAELTNMKLSDPERNLQDLSTRVGLLNLLRNSQGYNLQGDIGKAVSGDLQAQARVKLYMNMIHPGESTYQQDLLYRKNRDDAERFYDQWMKEKSSPTNPDFARFQTLNEDQRREEFRKDPRAAQYLNYLGPISISSDTPGAPRRPGSP